MFSKKDLIPCDRCVYKICKRCILNEKFSEVKASFCRHDECIYDLLDGDEASKFNCFVCKKVPLNLTYVCGTCGLNSKIPVDETISAIKTAVINSPHRIWEKSIEHINHRLLYFSIHDIDNDEFELVKSYKVDLIDS